MSLVEKIDQDLTGAMKSGDSAATSVLRLLKNSLKNEQIKLGQELSDDQAQKVLQREAKQRKDSVEAYQKGGRDDLAASEKAELEIIEKYLPDQMSEADLSKLVDEAISEVGASSIQDMGKVIGAVVKKTAGQADGSAVASLVRQKLK